MRAALEHLAEHEGRTVAVLGEMAELGPTSPEYHREIGELVSDLGIDVVLGVGELARAYGGEWVADAAKAAERAPELVQPGDVVLVKGSRAVGLEVVAEAPRQEFPPSGTRSRRPGSSRWRSRSSPGPSSSTSCAGTSSASTSARNCRPSTT